MAHYLSQIVPAPQGWVAHGEPVEGEEFWYETQNGLSMVYPDEWSGWILHIKGYEISFKVDTPERAFAMEKEPINILVAKWWATR